MHGKNTKCLVEMKHKNYPKNKENKEVTRNPLLLNLSECLHGQSRSSAIPGTSSKTKKGHNYSPAKADRSRMRRCWEFQRFQDMPSLETVGWR